jgi:predicted PurR-regulated permease PerM
MALFTFYLLADGPRVRRLVLSWVRPDRQVEVARIWEIAIEKTGGYVYSRALLATASAIFTYVSLRIIGIEFALALAIWVGVISQFIPAVGTYLAAIVPTLVALTDGLRTAAVVIIVLVVYQQIENLLIAPRITARTMSLHPAVAFGSAIAGASILGIVGAIIALPVAATVQAFVSTYFELYHVDEGTLGGPSDESSRDDMGAEPIDRDGHPVAETE